MKKITKISIPLILSMTIFSVYADIITWVGPDGGLYTNAANWSPPQVPTSNDIALFSSAGAGGNVNLTNGGTIFAGEFQFNSSASANPYQLFNNGVGNLEFQQAGVSNESGVTQFIAMQSATLNFVNSASASVVTGTPVQYDIFDNAVNFQNSSQAGNAHFILNGIGSVVTFINSSSGSSASFDLTNNSSFILSGHNMVVGTITSDNSATIRLDGTLTLGNDADQNIDGAIVDFAGGVGGLTKVGTGLLALRGTLTYTGNTTIQDGTLRLAQDFAGDIILEDATLQFFGTSIVYSGDISTTVAGSSVEIIGGSDVFFQGSNDIASLSILEGSTLVVDNAANFGDPSLLTLADGGRLASNGDIVAADLALGSGGGIINVNASTLTFDDVTGTGNNLTKTGNGTLVLSGTSSYGNTLLSDGILEGTTDSLINSITNNSLLRFSQTFAGIFTGDISGTGSVEITNSGPVTFAGPNSYTGNTSILPSATLVIGSDAALGSGGILEISDATLASSAPFTSSGRTMNVTGNASISTEGGNITWNGDIIGTGGIVKNSPGTLTLTGANSYNNSTTINEGTLVVNSSANLGNGPDIFLEDTLSILTSTTITQDLSLNTANATINTNANNVTLGGIIVGPGVLNKTGTGVLTIPNTHFNTYSGGTVISQGALSVDLTSRLGSGNITINGGELDFLAGDGVTKTITLGINNGTIDTNANSVDLQGLITGPGSLTKIGSGSLNISGTNDYAGGTIINGGTLIVTSDTNLGAASGDLTLNAATVNFLGNLSSARNVAITGAITFDTNANTVTFSGPISGTGSLTKTDSGILALSGTNTYTGGTTISAGTLQISNGSSIGTGTLIMGASTTLNTIGNLTLTNNITAQGLLRVDTDANTATLSGPITGSGGGFQKLDTGTLILSAANTNLGTTTVVGGTLRAIPQAITGNVSLAANTLEFVGNGTYAGNITASGGANVRIRQAGSTITFTGTNSLQATTLLSIIEGARLTVANNNNFGVLDPILTLSDGGTLTVTGSFTDSSAVNLGTGGGTFDISGAGTALTLSGAVSGVGNDLTKTGAGVLILNGTSNYGNTTITAGRLQGTTANLLNTITNNGTLTFSQTVAGTFTGNITGTGNVQLTSSGAITFPNPNSYTGTTTISGNGRANIGTDSALGNGGNLILSIGTIGSTAPFTSSKAVQITGSGTFNTSGGDITLLGNISGTGFLSKAGTGTLILGGNNTYTGSTFINGGTLAVNTAASIGSTSNVNIFNNTTFSALASFTTNRPFVINGANAMINTNANTLGISGVISGAGTLVKLGTGTLNLTGTNTYSGGTIVNEGTVGINSNANLGNAASNLTLNGGALGALSSFTAPRNIILLAGGGTVNTNANAVTLSGVISNVGSLTKIGTGTLTLTGANTYSGGTNFNEGAIAISTESNLGTGDWTFNGGTLLPLNDLTVTRDIALNTNGTFDTNGNDLTISGIISGAGSLTKEGAGVLALTGINTYSGGTNINAGILDFSADTNLGDSSGNITFGGGTLRVLNDLATARNVILNPGDGIIDTNSNNLDLTGEITGSGMLNKIGAGTLNLTGPNSYTGGTTVSDGVLQGTTTGLQGNITNNALVEFVQNFSGTYSGNLSGTGDVTIDGGGSVTYAGINDYTGTTEVINGSTLVGTTESLPGIINLNDASILRVDQSFNGIFDSTLTGDITTFFEKYGTGILTINNDLSGFLGTTTIVEGKISLNAFIGGDVFVPSGILGGVGTVGGDLNLSGTGTVAPANSIGVLTVLGNYVQTDATLLVHINGAGESSLLDVSGTATISGDSTVSVISDDGMYAQGVNYLFLQAAGGISGDFANLVIDNPMISGQILYNDPRTQAFLLFVTSFINVAGTQNEMQVAAQLDSITDPTAEQLAIIAALTALSPEAAQEALNQMTGQQYANLLGRAQLANRQFIRSLYNPVRERLTFDPRSKSYDPCFANYYEPGLEIWAQGSVGRGLFEGSTEARSVRISQYEVSVGAHTNLNESFLIGAAISYLRDNVRYTVGGNGENNTILGGLYGLYRPSFYYILGDFVIGHSNNFVSREINIGDLAFNPSTNVGMFQTAGYLEIGVDRYLPNLFVQPFFGIEVDYDEQDRLTERSGTPLDMTFESKVYKSAFGRLGAHFTPQLPFWDIYVTFDAAFDCRFNSTRNRIHGFFNDFGTDFTIIGTDFDRYGFDGSVFISKTFPQGVELFIEGSGFIGNRTSNYEGTIGIMLMW